MWYQEKWYFDRSDIGWEYLVKFPFRCQMMPWFNNRIRMTYFAGVGQRFFGGPGYNYTIKTGKYD